VSIPLAIALFVVGVLVSSVGASLFLRGAVDLARGLRIRSQVVDATVAAFAAAMPAVAVAITAAYRKQPELGVGDALGSNVVLMGLVFGLALLRAPQTVVAREGRRERFVAFAALLATAAFVVDGRISRVEAGALVAGFVVWLAMAVGGVRRPEEEAPIEETVQPLMVGFSLLGGVAALVGAGHLIVAGARGVGGALGLSAFVTGASLVALGPAGPSLVTAAIAARRGLDDVGVGAVLGSNLFHGLFVVGVSAAIQPARLAWREVAVSLAFGVLTLGLAIPGADGVLTRRRGGALVLCCVAYLAMVLATGYG
jgi:cation:H+ antiporter